MIRSLLSFFLLALSSLSSAEVPTYDIRQAPPNGASLVGIECHHRNLTLEIGLFIADNAPTKRMDLWNIEDLVKFNPSTYFLEKVETVTRRCDIDGVRYKVQLRGIPGANNAMWPCGGGTGVNAVVWRNEKIVLNEDLDKCNSENYISLVRFKDATAAPEVIRCRVD